MFDGRDLLAIDHDLAVAEQPGLMAVGAIHHCIGLQSLHGFIGENGGVRTVLAVGLPESPVDRLLCLPHIRVGRQSGNDL